MLFNSVMRKIQTRTRLRQHITLAKLQVWYHAGGNVAVTMQIANIFHLTEDFPYEYIPQKYRHICEKYRHVCETAYVPGYWLTTALLVTAEDWKQPNCLSIQDWGNKLWKIRTMESLRLWTEAQGSCIRSDTERSPSYRERKKPGSKVSCLFEKVKTRYSYFDVHKGTVKRHIGN